LLLEKKPTKNSVRYITLCRVLCWATFFCTFPFVFTCAVVPPPTPPPTYTQPLQPPSLSLSPLSHALPSYIRHTNYIQNCTSKYHLFHLQIYQSKCLRVTEDFPQRTPISNLHAHLQTIPIRQFIYHLTHKFFVRCPAHPNPLIHNTGNYTLDDLHRQYTKHRHKCIKHVLL
jgi:hypothetical protein